MSFSLGSTKIPLTTEIRNSESRAGVIQLGNPASCAPIGRAVVTDCHDSGRSLVILRWAVPRGGTGTGYGGGRAVAGGSGGG